MVIRNLKELDYDYFGFSDQDFERICYTKLNNYMDPYQTLGVSKDAQLEDIKNRWKTLAMKHHPDKGGDEQQFKNIQQAYETLSDPQKRAEYDNPNPFEGIFQGGDPFSQGGFQDIFRDIFGGRQQRQPVKNPDALFDMDITLHQAYLGTETTLSTPEGRVNLTIPPGVRHDALPK